MKIGEATSIRINQICNERGISLNKLADICCITQSTLESIVNGKSKIPNTLTIVRICDGLGIKLFEFYKDEIFDDIDRDD